jgi:hypothetical protein
MHIYLIPQMREADGTYAVPEEEDVDDGAPDSEEDRRPAHCGLYAVLTREASISIRSRTAVTRRCHACSKQIGGSVGLGMSACDCPCRHHTVPNEEGAPVWAPAMTCEIDPLRFPT